MGTWSGSETGRDLGGPRKDFDGVIHGGTRGGSASVAAAVSESAGLWGARGGRRVLGFITHESPLPST